ncbi:Tol-Pal system beta propeller repeat protein TolB [hydrothermal vent metagenome]|uniref:Tol-Pal system beta propeller repeat protein TolB n=1 Tax=hydrothermal vent metagenome TaxID=652676 RepID=A0A3B0W1E0_9ZZZZ
MKKTTLQLFLSLLIFFATTIQAQVEFIITRSNDSAISIAILPFSNNIQATNLAMVISDDLNLSGQFQTVAKEQLIEQPKYASQIKYSTWRLLGADYITIGSINGSGSGRYELSIKLFSVADQQQLLALTLPVLEGDLRAGGHYIADKIYEEITGIKGIFSTKIAYVTATKLAGGIEYQLLVADADGKNSQVLVTSSQPLLSPSWSPLGDKLAYVSFEKGNSAIYIQNLSTGGRELMSNYKGINSSPSFSPDGKQLALTLSKSGNPEIYLMDIYTKKLTKVTNSWAIDIEANWSPDGKNLVFTSDRGGKPNLYQVNLQTLATKRLTFEGNYNAGGSFSPNGDYICYVQGNKNIYKIALRHNKSETSQQISDGPLDETPTFAPNNNMVLYASKNSKGQGILISTSLDGSTKNQLLVSNGHIKNPSWSPVIN